MSNSIWDQGALKREVEQGQAITGLKPLKTCEVLPTAEFVRVHVAGKGGQKQSFPATISTVTCLAEVKNGHKMKQPTLCCECRWCEKAPSAPRLSGLRQRNTLWTHRRTVCHRLRTRKTPRKTRVMMFFRSIFHTAAEGLIWMLIADTMNPIKGSWGQTVQSWSHCSEQFKGAFEQNVAVIFMLLRGEKPEENLWFWRIPCPPPEILV